MGISNNQFLIFFYFVKREFDIFYYLKNGKHSSQLYNFIIWILVLFTCATIIFSLMTFEYRKHESYYSIKNIMYEDKLISADSVNYVIGMTNNYIFLYHEKDKNTTVYNRKNIKYLNVKQK